MSKEESEWDQEKDRIKKIVDDCVAKIGEHVDAVQVIVSHHNQDASNTMSYEKGSGNFHTRLGSVQEWIEVQRQHARNWAIRNDNKDNEDD